MQTQYLPVPSGVPAVSLKFGDRLLFIGGAVGYLVTDASCSPGSCGFVAALIGLVTAVGAAVGVGVVVVLALKSLSEWREHGDREITIRQEREGPPTC